MIAILLAVLLVASPPIPGATNPAVTQKTISATICRRGYSTAIRPPVSYTGPLKRSLAKSEGITSLRSVQLDHLLPLELGGAPRSLKNLWLEPITEAHHKDREENSLHRALCSGKMTLRAAQRKMLHDWRPR